MAGGIIIEVGNAGTMILRGGDVEQAIIQEFCMNHEHTSSLRVECIYIYVRTFMYTLLSCSAIRCTYSTVVPGTNHDDSFMHDVVPMRSSFRCQMFLMLLFSAVYFDGRKYSERHITFQPCAR